MSKKKFGKATHPCRLCGTYERPIRRYGIMICGRCFRERARDLGFKKYS